MNDKKLYLLLLYLSMALQTACGGSGGGGAAMAGIEGSGGDAGDDPTVHPDFRQFVVADVNGDGQGDVVAAAVHVDAKQQRLGAIFEFLDPRDPPVSVKVDCEPMDIAVGDLNNDGRADVVTSCRTERGFRLFLQKPSGGGRLLPWTLIAMPGEVDDLTIADVDGDGLPDVLGVTLVPAVGWSLAFATQKTAAPGTFNAVVSVGESLGRVLAADLNGDGLVDLTTTSSGGDVIEYLQDPAVPGTFEPKVVAACPDACAGPGNFRRAYDVSGPPLVTAGSFNAGDRACPNCVRPAGWWAAPGLSPVRKGGPPWWRLAVADIDGDGRGDVVLLADGLFDVYLQTTPNTFVRDGSYGIPATAVYITPHPWAIVIADIDRDGLPDVAVSTGELFYFPQDPDARGKFGAAVKIGPP